MTDDAGLETMVLAVGMSTFDEPHTWIDLPRVRSDISDLVSALSGRVTHVEPLSDATVSETQAALSGLVSERRAEKWHGPMIVVWAGHGANEDRSTLRLVARDTGRPIHDSNSISPGQLVQTALATGAEQLLVVLDTCHSGAGVLDAITAAITTFHGQSSGEGRGPWFGIVASCLPLDRMSDEDGIVGALARLMTHGLPGYQPPWVPSERYVTGKELVDALDKEWSAAGRELQQATFHRARFLLPNPLYSAEAGDRLVTEILDPSAQSRFVGRRRILSRMVEWSRAQGHGVLSVVGSAGVGKSTLLRRYADLSVASRRPHLPSGYGTSGDDALPPDRTTVLVPASRLSVDGVIAAIATEYGRPDVTDLDDLAALFASDHLEVLVLLDALDEAKRGALAGLLFEVVPQLSRDIQVIVSTRPVEVRGADIDEALAALGTVIEIDADEELLSDIEDFVAESLAEVG